MRCRLLPRPLQMLIEVSPDIALVGLSRARRSGIRDAGKSDDHEVSRDWRRHIRPQFAYGRTSHGASEVDCLTCQGIGPPLALGTARSCAEALPPGISRRHTTPAPRFARLPEATFGVAS